ncbi:hypothetical protein [Paenibacillus macquariensis]|uniref:Post-SET domain-containing protein n=1 Tax=Paenibacillus macquariensis TaxID=948756 RepID=A0ABY1K925_9BACL|nr:hypothetical protein [Paenibacillus macquariensis]MEC0091535.1 hypothetical protein [Paenibacillus macquariensis]OAB26666.1 hypothetical protein PMSM_26225 [Paenibacillus macquariensis subsp. macquariensis]SIR44260.1 hypothetical protein SAMN05421578_11441 [Paenibacillus macquariensis]
MTEMAEVILDVRPGLLIGTVNRSLDELSGMKKHEVNIPVEVCSPLIQQEILIELQNAAHDLYLLLKGETPMWLVDLLPSSTDIMMMNEATCHCGNPNCEEMITVRKYAEQQLSADPVMRLTLMGLPRKELLSGVFGVWSAAIIPKAKEFAGVEASLIEEKGKSGPSPGEWLAEAAEQGRLHEPGPLFREVTLKLTPPEDGENQLDDWTPLLKGSLGVQKALKMIMKKTSDISEKRRRQFIGE